MSAVRNLSGREVSGRPLRIDSATNAPGENFRGSQWGYSGALVYPNGCPLIQVVAVQHQLSPGPWR